MNSFAARRAVAVRGGLAAHASLSVSVGASSNPSSWNAGTEPHSSLTPHTHTAVEPHSSLSPHTHTIDHRLQTLVSNRAPPRSPLVKTKKCALSTAVCLPPGGRPMRSTSSSQNTRGNSSATCASSREAAKAPRDERQPKPRGRPGASSPESQRRVSFATGLSWRLVVSLERFTHLVEQSEAHARDCLALLQRQRRLELCGQDRAPRHMARRAAPRFPQRTRSKRRKSGSPGIDMNVTYIV